MTRIGFQNWTPMEEWGTPGEIAWQLRYPLRMFSCWPCWRKFSVVGNTAFATSYIGDHYSTDASNVKVFFNYTTDGKTWKPFDVNNPVVYYGGVSEVGFEFDLDGNVWGVMRNEDGDSYGTVLGLYVLYLRLPSTVLELAGEVTLALHQSQI